MAPKKNTVSMKPKRNPRKTSLFQYSEHQMMSAVEEAKTNRTDSLRVIAQKFNVPRATLSKKVNGTHPVQRKMGPGAILGSPMENKIVKCLFTLADAGFPVSKEQFMQNVSELACKQPENPFKNGRPGEKWFKLFCSRHPSIRMRVAQNLSRVRSAVSEENLRNWFDHVRKFCETNNCTEALNSPDRIYNLDETAFFLSPEIGKVMTRRGARTVYNVTKANDRQCTTVLMGGNAAGLMAPSMVVFKNKIIPKNVSNNWPANWGIGERG